LLLWDPSPTLLRSGLLLQIWGILCFVNLMSTVLLIQYTYKIFKLLWRLLVCYEGFS
jgi:hypothetical protein